MGSPMWDARYAASQLWDLEPSPLVVSAVGKAKAGRALDLASGDGRHAFWLAARGWQVTAVDQAALAIGRIQSRGAILGLPVRTVQAELGSYMPGAGNFDLVLISYLEANEQIFDQALRAAALGLDDGGRLIVVGEDQSNADFGGGSNRTRLIAIDRLARMARSRGLIVVRSEIIQRQIRSDVGVRTSFDHILEALRFDLPRGEENTA